MRDKNIVVILSIIIAVLVIALAIAIVYIMALRNQNSANKKNQQIVINNTSSKNDVDESSNIIENNVVVDARETEKASFNALFENYVGNNISSAQVNTLLNRIDSNNVSGSHKVILDDLGITSLSEVEATKTYNAELTYDDEGYVNTVRITESTDGPVTEPESDLQKIVFNAQFTKYEGDITGAEVINMAQAIVASNGTNPNHQVGVTSSQGTVQSFDTIDQTALYTTVISYDSDGWVEAVDINAK